MASPEAVKAANEFNVQRVDGQFTLDEAEERKLSALLDKFAAQARLERRYEVGYNKPIHGNWGLQYEITLQTDDLEEAKAEIRKQKSLGHTRGLLLYDAQEKIICVQPNEDGGFE